MRRFWLGPIAVALFAASYTSRASAQTASARTASVQSAAPRVSTPGKEAAADTVAKERPTVSYFYGTEIILTGGAGGLLTGLSVFLPERPLNSPLSTAGFIVGTPAFAISGPVVHWSHGNFDKGLLSLAANAAVPALVGLVAGPALCTGGSGNDCGFKGFFRGFGVGAMVVPLIDAVVLGWERIPVEDASAHFGPRHAQSRARAFHGSSEASSWAMQPTLGWTPRGELTLGLQGHF